ncbi:hypothetical protein [Stutzerimonas nitrititolerans]|uniref:hypothetical protein n=1 Tax=Stutzerimonas nitrititolerans TaxID=2482751 RepID=UPI0028ACCE95|nr:hypothetical protein [Stutzerimonas nitrititolerans]
MKVSTRENLYEAIGRFYKATLWLGPPLALLLVILSEALGWDTYWAVVTVLFVYCAPMVILGVVGMVGLAAVMSGRLWGLLGRVSQG